MNRAERRRQAREDQREAAEMRASAYARAIVRQDAARQKALERLSQNGITPEDLKAEYDKGYAKGFMEAGDSVLKSCFAAVCLALDDLYNFKSERCAKVLRAMDEHMTYTLTSAEAIEEVYKRMKLKLDFKEAFDRIQEL